MTFAVLASYRLLLALVALMTPWPISHYTGLSRCSTPFEYVLERPDFGCGQELAERWYNLAAVTLPVGVRLLVMSAIAAKSHRSALPD